MNYQYLDDAGPAGGPHRYRFQAVVYFNKEVGSVAPDGYPFITVEFYARDQNTTLVRKLRVPRISFKEIKPPTPNGCTSTAPRTTLARFGDIVTLPYSANGYLAVYRDGARNMDVVNIVNPGGAGMTLTLDMTPPTLRNSSPVFADTAVFVICHGDINTVLNNAYDPDGDRLVYAFGRPKYDVTADRVRYVEYPAGYSEAEPFGAGGLATVDAGSGLARYASPTVGKFVLAVDVSEYRRINGQEVLLGVTRRDIQLVVRACTGAPPLPPAFTPATLAVRDFTVREGQTLTFTLAAVEPNGANLRMKVSSALLDGPNGIESTLNGLPGIRTAENPTGSVTIVGQGSVSGVFRLTADCGLVRAAPYDVGVIITSDACGGKTVAEIFRVRVVQSEQTPTRVRGDSVVCSFDTGRYTAEGSAASRYRWTVRGGAVVGPASGRTVTVQWAQAASGTVTVQALSAAGCATDSVQHPVVLRAGPSIAGETLYCPKTNAGLQFSATDGTSSAFRWSITNGSIVRGQGTAAVVVAVAPGASAALRVVSTTGNGCPSEVLIRPDDACLVFYNVITPNQDGLNDAFVIENIERHPDSQLRIYSRWGRELYRTTGYRNDWRGDTQPAGTYYYYLHLPDGRTFKGWFELVR